MDVGKQGDAEVHHVPAQHLGLPCSLQGHGQGGRGGHSAHRGEVGGPVVAQDLPGLLPGVEPRQQIQNCQPEVVSHHHDQDHDEEDGQLAGDAALIGQPAEGARDKEGQDGDHHPRDHRQHHPLELLQHLGDDLGPGPGGRQAHQHRKDQRGHHRHDGRDVQVEQQLRRLPQPLRRRLDGQAGDDGVAGPH